MTDQWITPHPHEQHTDPAEHWRDCHACAIELLQRLANGVLLYEKITFPPNVRLVKRVIERRTQREKSGDCVGSGER